MLVSDVLAPNWRQGICNHSWWRQSVIDVSFIMPPHTSAVRFSQMSDIVNTWWHYFVEMLSESNAPKTELFPSQLLGKCGGAYDFFVVSLKKAVKKSCCWSSEIPWRSCDVTVIGFNHGLPCYVKNMARGTQVDKNRGRRPRFLSWLRPEGHVFNIAWQAMIKTYYSMFSLWFNWFFFHKNARNSKIGMLWSASDLVAGQNRLLLWMGCLATYINWKLYVHLSLWHSRNP